jgi:peptidoglycan/LPS O-acetylase OafA/YrhL
MTRKLGYLPALDGLRALSIGAVLAVHGWHFRGGQLGVDLFFVISGFLITSLLLNERSDRGSVSLRAFYRRRALRLLPALVLLLIAFASYETVVLGTGWRGIAGAAVGLSYTTNLLLIFDPQLVALHLGHLWSLATEEQFYLLWPPLLLLLLRRFSVRAVRRMLLAATGLVAVEAILFGTGGNEWRFWVGPDTQAAPILLGCAAGIAWTHDLKRVSGRSAVIAAALLVPIWFAFNNGAAAFAVPLFAICSARVLLYLVATPDAAAARLLSTRPLVAVGKASYGIYLWHFPLFYLAGAWLGLPLTAVVVFVSYRFVEQPFLRRKRRPDRALVAPAQAKAALATAIVAASMLLLAGSSSASPRKAYWTQSQAETAVIAKVRLPYCRVFPADSACGAGSMRVLIGIRILSASCVGADELRAMFTYSRFTCDVTTYGRHAQGHLAVYVTGPGTFRWKTIS